LNEAESIEKPLLESGGAFSTPCKEAILKGWIVEKPPILAIPVGA
jgi:hypothetical protein